MNQRAHSIHCSRNTGSWPISSACPRGWRALVDPAFSTPRRHAVSSVRRRGTKSFTESHQEDSEQRRRSPRA